MAFAEKNAAYLITTAGEKKNRRVGQICFQHCDICMGTELNIFAESRCLKRMLEIDLQRFIRI